SCAGSGSSNQWMSNSLILAASRTASAAFIAWLASTIRSTASPIAFRTVWMRKIEPDIAGKPQLDRPETLLDEALCLGGQFRFGLIEPEAAAGIGRPPVAAAAYQRGDRQPSGLAAQVPHGAVNGADAHDGHACEAEEVDAPPGVRPHGPGLYRLAANG